MNEKNSPDEIRRKYLYRSLIVKGQIQVRENKSTRGLVGPDCAYHLYSHIRPASTDPALRRLAEEGAEKNPVTSETVDSVSEDSVIKKDE